MLLQKKSETKLTYADYYALEDNRSYELKNGILCVMAPPPTEYHGTIRSNLARLLGHILYPKNTRPYPAPFEVILPEHGQSREQAEYVLKPDLCLVLEDEKLFIGGCQGPPDLVVEIHNSPIPASKLAEKYRLYQMFGVREYWLLQAADRLITQVTFENGREAFRRTFREYQSIKPAIFPDLKLEAYEIFQDFRAVGKKGGAGSISKKPRDKWTYADYYAMDDDQRYEVTAGVIRASRPGPSDNHQTISSNLHRMISVYLYDKPEVVFAAPFDVILAKEGQTRDEAEYVFQPDMLVIRDSSKRIGRGCLGAPEWVIEIESPSTAKRDQTVKYDAYRDFGVQEYWLVDPQKQLLTQILFREGQEIFRKKFLEYEIIRPDTLPGLEIEVHEIFKDVGSYKERMKTKK